MIRSERERNGPFKVAVISGQGFRSLHKSRLHCNGSFPCNSLDPDMSNFKPEHPQVSDDPTCANDKVFRDIPSIASMAFASLLASPTRNTIRSKVSVSSTNSAPISTLWSCRDPPMAAISDHKRAHLSVSVVQSWVVNCLYFQGTAVIPTSATGPKRRLRVLRCSQHRVSAKSNAVAMEDPALKKHPFYPGKSPVGKLGSWIFHFQPSTAAFGVSPC